MDPARRPRYLKALGIEAWQRRGADVAATAPVIPEPAAALAASPLLQPAAAAVPVVEVRAPQPAEAPRAPIVAAAGWDELQAQVASCTRCRLCETRTKTVFGVGPLRSPLMVVGEGPGADEDAQGEPFVGRAGKLLDEMLRALGRARKSDTKISNVGNCRPPRNSEPAEDEAESCRPFLEQQLKTIKPKLIVALGRVAAQRLLVTDTPIGKMRGQTYQWGPDQTPLMVTYHPAYLLRNPGEKAKSWEDLKRIHRFLTA